MQVMAGNGGTEKIQKMSLCDRTALNDHVF
jgi:hypothetical protein